jgi:mannose-6-phosphate isomerase-like protein (cupin superfamily)
VGKVVTFDKLLPKQIGGASTATIAGAGEMKEMAAEFVRVAPGQAWTDTVPRGSDCYVFMLDGTGTITADSARHRLLAQSFAAIQEGSAFTVKNGGATAANLVKVIAPPQPKGATTGFTGGIAVSERASTPVLDLPKDKKKRIYFAGPHAAKTERGHAMIVVYEKDTVTALHHHPNAESMFVILDGALNFTINDEQVKVAPGQAAVFGLNDRHGLRVADGLSGASFLEFHIPAAYTTVK